MTLVVTAIIRLLLIGRVIPLKNGVILQSSDTLLTIYASVNYFSLVMMFLSYNTVACRFRTVLFNIVPRDLLLCIVCYPEGAFRYNVHFAWLPE